MGERARDILAGRVRPVPARDAATVMLLRDSSQGLRVYMLRRQSTMAFAAGAYVFPGGSVDPRDADHAVAWAGPSPREWGELLGAEEAIARALVCAAVRETFEESGVLLAGPSEDSVVEDTTGDDWEADREALIGRSLAFADFLDKRGLVLRSDLMRPWAHWITPEVESKRYDTRFFAAALPPGQRTRDVGGEADRVAWVLPAEGVAAGQRGEMFMLPPTYTALTELAEFATTEDALAAERRIVPYMPRIAEVGEEIHLVLPETTYGLPGKML
ncbi:NUDIX hydrolase [Bailinhaonella thermotolerans]|uniref:NUDIX hydrolase n=1 Tax=Bailinhaonella thermotolerans TaxID=1070861 RepID=A0A3A4A0V5_9ACTN|nr:NUDIX hydrolase [Bailinhaonella thermotolerans]RJL22009.1 NUDIX hydrolase [Bailinhaonella thermotolerans]